MPTWSPWRTWTALILLPAFVLPTTRSRADLPEVPDGFSVRLVASVPAVEYPCQVATAPDGSLFVAEDPMDQRGPYEAFDGRILRFRDDRPPALFAEGFRAVQGMAWHDDALYVCHMPFLTIVRDTDGDGVADAKEDLYKDLGPTANQGLNDHIVSGIQFGMDGWLYISVGDKGVPGATRPEDGQVVQLKGGGVLRCRPDGSKLEVYSSGTRNHLEANLNDRDEVFTYDNTDDGDGWWTRVTHHVDGGYYGYAYDYHDRHDVMLPAMAEYGGGSPCGAVFYREDAWPEAWRGVGYWAEWGKGKVHAFRFRPRGASYEIAEAIDFALPGASENFRPIDLALSHDGRTLYVADWNMGGWGKPEKVGRIWAIESTQVGDLRPRGHDADPLDAQLRQLDHPAHAERSRAQQAIIRIGEEAIPRVIAALDDPEVTPLAKRHLIWVLDGIAGGRPEATMPTIALLRSPEADLRAQAARALGLRSVPIAGEPIAKLLVDPAPTVRLQAVIALGRIGLPDAVLALLPLLADDDPTIAFSVRVALRRIGEWGAVAEGLNSDDATVREGVLLTLERVYDPAALGPLVEYALNPEHPAAERARALSFVGEVHREAEPWDGSWWGTRPTRGSPPAKVREWIGTLMALETVREGLADDEAAVRLAAVEATRAIGDRDSLERLRERFPAEPDDTVRTAMVAVFGALKDDASLPMLIRSLLDPDSSAILRDAVLGAVESIGSAAAVPALVELLDGGTLADDQQPRILAALGALKAEAAVPALVGRLQADSPAVRAAAAEALGQIGVVAGVSEALRPLVDDPEPDVLEAAIRALGRLRDRESIPALIEAAGRRATEFDATMALTAFPDTRAIHVFLRGLTSRSTELRRASAEALGSIREQAAPILEQLASRNELPPRAVPELRRVFQRPAPISEWRILGPLPRSAEVPFDPEAPVDLTASHVGVADQPLTWTLASAIDGRGQVDLNRLFAGDQRTAYGYAELTSDSDRNAALVVGSDDTLTVWLNGQQVYDFGGDRGFNPRQDSVEVELQAGVNRVLVRCSNSGGPWQFAVSATESADYAFLAAPSEGSFDPESFREHTLANPGDPARGLALFNDLEGLACIKCHVVSGQGGDVGPDLTGVGAKYAIEELIASVLYPSQQIFSGYEPIVVATTDGRVLTGILKGETPEVIEIQDAEAAMVRIPADEVEERRLSDVSIMPSGLAEGLSPEDFTDLIAYLASLKEASAGAAGDDTRE